MGFFDPKPVGTLVRPLPWETSVGMNPKTREEMGWPAEFEEEKSM